MQHLQRTQVYLEEAQIQQLKASSQKNNVPMSVLIRQAIDQFLAEKMRSSGWGKDTLASKIGKITLKTTTASKDHDQLLYGE